MKFKKYRDIKGGQMRNFRTYYDIDRDNIGSLNHSMIFPENKIKILISLKTILEL